MKYKYLLLFLFFSAAFSLASSCKKHEDPTPKAEIDKLPPATQTGANTMGALVNGQAFVPNHGLTILSAPYQCNYIYTNGGYYFNLNGSNKNDNNVLTTIIVGTNALPISEGQTLTLGDYNTPGNAFGIYFIDLQNYKTQNNNGQLHITKFDQIKQIVSGTFFFNVVSSNGETIHITDGRFDMKYTQ